PAEWISSGFQIINFRYSQLTSCWFEQPSPLCNSSASFSISRTQCKILLRLLYHKFMINENDFHLISQKSFTIKCTSTKIILIENGYQIAGRLTYMKKKWMLLTAMILLVLAACSSADEETATNEEAAGEPVTITGTNGEVKLDAPAKKVVVLEWTYAEDLLAVGVQPAGMADIVEYGNYVNIE